MESGSWQKLNLRRSLLRACCSGLMLEEGLFFHGKRAELSEKQAWCSRGLIVHFFMAGMIKWAGVENDGERDRGCFARGGEGRPRCPGTGLFGLTLMR